MIEKKKIRKRPEQDLQMTCVRWFKYQYPKLKNCLFHVPNQRGNRKFKELGILAGMGVVNGVPDLILVYNKTIYPFELKSKKGSASDSQNQVHSDWMLQGIETKIIDDFEVFRKEINSILV